MLESRKAMRPILILSQSTGIFPMNFEFEIAAAYSWYSGVVLLTIMLSGVYREYLRGLDIITSAVNYWTMNIVALVCVVSTVTNRSRIRSYLYNCDQIYQRLVELGLRPRCQYARNLSQVKLVVVISIALYVIELYAYQTDAIVTSVVFAMYNAWDFIGLVKIVEFAHLVMMSTESLIMINLYTRTKGNQIKGEEEIWRFGELVKIFHDVHMNCRHLNKAYALPLLSLTASSFVCMLIDAYHSANNLNSSLQDNASELDGLQFFSRTIWVAYRIGKLWYLSKACCSIKSEAKTFTIEMREILTTADSGQIVQTEELIRSHHLLFSNVNFTATGFYRVDFPMILSVIATVGSYLVIIIQFQTANR